MPQSLSPKKYIETKVRNLPVYKCLVNADWEESGMANVIVMRKHVNGNISGAVYLVDLQCLGIKDSTWFFNEEEEEMMERFAGIHAPALVEIDYKLAHNIVYTGHDFAMDYDIHPHEDFKTSRFVLEEDDEKIPMVEVKTGYGKDGIPHLMAYHPGQYADALAKLKKNAGEGNYLYTVGMFDNGEDGNFENEGDEDGDTDGENLDEEDIVEEEDNMDEDDDYSLEPDVPLSTFEDGTLTLQSVQDVRSEDLADEAQLDARSNMEQMICITEMLLRTLQDDFFDEEAEWAEDEWELFEDVLPFPNGITATDFEEWATVTAKETEPQSNDDDEWLRILTSEYAHNPLVTTMLISNAIAANNGEAAEMLEKWEPAHGQLPLFQLLQAFNEEVENKYSGTQNNILLNDSLKDVFTTVESFSPLEIGVFHALQTIRNARLQNLSLAVQHYYLAAATDFVHILFLPMMVELLPPLQAKVMEQYIDETE